MKLSVEKKQYRLLKPFNISRGSRSLATVVEVKIEDNGLAGIGECVPYARYEETTDSVQELIQSVKLPVDRRELQTLLPPGAARNAVDCALWDLESKQTGLSVWQLADLEPPKPVNTAYTISLGSPEKMKEDAKAHAHYELLKVKLGGGEEDYTRINAVREGAPKARLIVDANEGWGNAEFIYLAPKLYELGVEMVEQPLPAGDDFDLVDKSCPIPVCADESCHGLESFSNLPKGYSYINIKLDKTGGLTEALELKAQAKKSGYKIMTGCMMGSSLSMAPAVFIAQGAHIVDLDAPLLLAEDHDVPLHYQDGQVYPPVKDLWG